MPPKRSRKQPERPESPAGSGQSPESVADDLAKQPELLAAAADLLKKRQAAALQSELEPPRWSLRSVRASSSRRRAASAIAAVRSECPAFTASRSKASCAGW